jgi:glycosyltransferase involved in cell wall biosynthesis
MKNRGLDFEIRIVGSSGFDAKADLSPFERQLRDLATDLGDSVVFVPFQDRKQVVEEYRRATIFCVPSNWDEPCSLTVPEGMACGLPVVTSRRGGLPEVGAGGVHYFMPPATEELADRLADLLTTPALRQSLSQKALMRAHQISWKNQYALVHQAIFGEAPPSSAV